MKRPFFVMLYSADGETAVHACNKYGYPLFFKTRQDASKFAGRKYSSWEYEIVKLSGRKDDQSKPTTF